MDENEDLIQKRSIQSFRGRTEELTNTIGATGATEEDSNSTIGKDRARNEDDGLSLEEGEIVEDEGKNTEAAVASDESEDLCAMGAAVKSTGGKNRPVDSKDRKNKYWSKKETTIMKKDNTERGGGSSVRG